MRGMHITSALVSNDFGINDIGQESLIENENII